MTDPYDAMTIEAQKARIEEVEAALKLYAEEVNWKQIISAYGDVRRVFLVDREKPWSIASKALGQGELI